MCDTLCSGGRGGYALFMEASEVLEVPEVIRCVLLCVLEAVEGTRCLLEGRR